jgi:hypothetical protein
LGLNIKPVTEKSVVKVDSVRTCLEDNGAARVEDPLPEEVVEPILPLPTNPTEFLARVFGATGTLIRAGDADKVGEALAGSTLAVALDLYEEMNDSSERGVGAPVLSLLALLPRTLPISLLALLSLSTLLLLRGGGSKACLDPVRGGGSSTAALNLKAPLRLPVEDDEDLCAEDDEDLCAGLESQALGLLLLRTVSNSELEARDVESGVDKDPIRTSVETRGEPSSFVNELLVPSV